MVCAPSLIPRKPDERVKTGRRDALKLARALRAGDLSAVYVPGVEDEAFRDLARVWVTAKEDLKQERQRLESFPLSHGVHYTGRADWGPAHRHWVSQSSRDRAMCGHPIRGAGHSGIAAQRPRIQIHLQPW